MISKGKIAPLVEQQFPAVYREEGQFLVSFVKTYYEWLESTGNALYHSRKIPEYFDIDLTPEEFLPSYKEKYLPGFALLNETDKRTLVKHSLDIYRSKGSVRAIKLLFKLVYGEEAEVYWPGDDVFKPSSAVYHVPKYLEVTVTAKAETLVGKQITGSQSGASAIVESVSRRKLGSVVFDMIQLSSVRGLFEHGEVITNDGTFEDAPRIIGSVTNLIIKSKGREYEVGEVLDVISSESGHGGKARVTSIQNQSGQVSYDLVDGGYGYSLTPSIYVSEKVLGISNLRPWNRFVPSEGFNQLEEIRQPLSNVGFASATSSFVLGSYVLGVDVANTIVSTGVIVENLQTGTSGWLLLSDHTTDLIQIDTIVDGDATTGTYSPGELVYQDTVGSNTAVGQVIGANATHIFVDRRFGEFVANTTLYASTRSTTANVVVISTYDEPAANLSITDYWMANTTNALSSLSVILASATGAKQDRTASGLYIGGNTAYAGLYAVSPSYPFKPSESAHVIGVVSNAYANVTTVSSGDPGGFQVGSIADAEYVYINTDELSGNNFNGITFTDLWIRNHDIEITLSSNTNFNVGDKVYQRVGGTTNTAVGTIVTIAGANATVALTTLQGALVQGELIYSANVTPGTATLSTLTTPGVTADAGIVTSVTIVAGGSGYTNGNITLAGGNPTSDGTVTITTNGSGTITAAVVNNAGSGYRSVPFATPTGGTGASLIPVVQFGYGFSGNVAANSSSLIIDALSYTNTLIGSITSIANINPGNLNTVDPVVLIIEKAIAGADIREELIVPTDVVGSFVVGEEITQDYTLTYSNVEFDTFTGNTSFAAGEGIVQERADGVWVYGTVLSQDLSLSPHTVSVGSVHATNGQYGVAVLGATFNTSNGIVGLSSGVVTSNVNSSANSTFDSLMRGNIVASDSNGLRVRRKFFGTGFVAGRSITGVASTATANVVSAQALDNSPVMGNNSIVSTDAGNARGTVTTVSVLDSGVAYQHGEIVTLTADGNPYVATAVVELLNQGVGEGRWNTIDGFVSSEKKLQDSDYYQEYSYEIQSSLSKDIYEAKVKESVHVAGTRMFGAVVSQSIANNQTTSPVSNAFFTVEVSNAANFTVGGNTVLIQDTPNTSGSISGTLIEVTSPVATSFNASSNVVGGQAATFDGESSVTTGSAYTFNANTDVIEGVNLTFDGSSNVVSGVIDTFNANNDVANGVAFTFDGVANITPGFTASFDPNQITSGTVEYFTANVGVTPAAVLTFNANSGVRISANTTFDANTDVTGSILTVDIAANAVTTSMTGTTVCATTPWSDYVASSNTGGVDIRNNKLSIKSSPLAAQALVAGDVALYVNTDKYPVAGLVNGYSYKVQSANATHLAFSNKFEIVVGSNTGFVVGNYVYQMDGDTLPGAGVTVYMTPDRKSIVAPNTIPPSTAITLNNVTAIGRVASIYNNTVTIEYTNDEQQAFQLYSSISGVTCATYANFTTAANVVVSSTISTTLSATRMPYTIAIGNSSVSIANGATVFQRADSLSAANTGKGTVLYVNNANTSNKTVVIDASTIEGEFTNSYQTASGSLIPGSNLMIGTVGSNVAIRSFSNRVPITPSTLPEAGIGQFKLPILSINVLKYTKSVQFYGLTGMSVTGANSVFKLTDANTYLSEGQAIKITTSATKGIPTLINTQLAQSTYYVQFANSTVFALANTYGGGRVALVPPVQPFAASDSVSYNFTQQYALATTRLGTIAKATANTLFAVGDPLFYSVNAGNTAVGGMTKDSIYYVQFANTTTFAVSSSNTITLTTAANTTVASGSVVYQRAGATGNNTNTAVGTVTQVNGGIITITTRGLSGMFTATANLIINSVANVALSGVDMSGAARIPLTKGKTESGHVVRYMTGSNSTIATTGGAVFQPGDPVQYTTSLGNSAVVGITANAIYYIDTANSTAVSLSATRGGPRLLLTNKGNTEAGHYLSGISTIQTSNAYLFNPGERVRYISDAGNTAIGGLVNNQVYYVHSTIDVDRITLATQMSTGKVGTNVFFNSSTSVTGGTGGGANSTITIANANSLFDVGDAVYYNVSGGNTALANLVSGEVYYIESANASVVSLSSTIGGSRIITASGVGELGHQLVAISRGRIGLTRGATTSNGHSITGEDLKSTIATPDAGKFVAGDQVVYNVADGTTPLSDLIINAVSLSVGSNVGFVVGNPVWQRVGGTANTGVATVAAIGANTILLTGSTLQGTFVTSANVFANSTTNTSVVSVNRGSVYTVQFANTTHLSLNLGSGTVGGGRRTALTKGTTQQGHLLTQVGSKSIIATAAGSNYNVGDLVKYNVDPGYAPVSGLANGTTYFVQFANSTAIALAATATGIRLPVAQSLTSGNAHTISLQDGNTNYITLASANSFVVGDKVLYSVAAGNTTIGGLRSGNEYYIQFVNNSVITLANTVGGDRINLTSGADETGHTITAVGSRSVILTPLARSVLVGDEVVYYPPSFDVNAIGGLNANTSYFVQFANSTAIALANTSGGTRITLTQAGANSPGHVLSASGRSSTFIAPSTQFEVGDRVLYTVRNGNTAMIGLTPDETYYIQFANNTLFAVANNMDIVLAVNSSSGFNVNDVVYQRKEGSANSAVGTVIDVNTGYLTINAASAVGRFVSSSNVFSTNASPANTNVTSAQFVGIRMPLSRGKTERGHTFSSYGDHNTIATANASAFSNGDAVTYITDVGNTAIVGLSNNTGYFVQFANATHIALTTSVGGSRVALTSVGQGAGHYLVQSGNNSYIKTSLGATVTIGEPVIYKVAAGNTAIGGLTNNTTYYVEFANTTAIALANTIGGPRVSLTAGDNQVGHSLQDSSLNTLKITNVVNNSIAPYISIAPGLTISQTNANGSITYTANIVSVDASL